VARYPNVDDVRWVQEEPENQGPWWFVRPRLERVIGERPLRYVGRDEGASPATGNYKIHQAEERALVDQALKRPRAVQREERTHEGAERAAG